MLDFPRWKMVLTVVVLAIGVLFALPSLLPERATAGWPAALSPRINLGLDLAGGSHILLEAKTEDVASAALETKEDEVRQALRQRPRVEVGDISRAGGRLSFLVRDATQLDTARERVNNLTSGAGLTGQRDWELSVVDGSRIVLTPTAAGLANRVDEAMTIARDVIDRRINELGTREPTIIREGDNRIVVEVPGLKDSSALKELIGKTAKLEFKLVDETASPEELAAGRAPIGSQVLRFVSGEPIAVRRQVMVAGDEVTGAGQGFGQSNEPVVTLQFNSSGARKFARTTQENVGKPFAIILDNQVLSAPNINEPILGGSAQISGSFTVESANNLAISLKSGSLPVDLTVVQENTVGPDLGADSIRSGVIAAAIATIAVLVFMIVTYGLFGVFADLALIVNILVILGIMALINATLTLPGIAGFVLTVGAAVDANVLINERIREELKRGRRVLDAVTVGYREATRAIFDANITNVIAGALMFAFGSGPVKGFAVVLVIGILTSVFTAVTFSRMMVAIYLRRSRPTAIAI